ncbi:type II secretion system protein [Granulicella sp. S190]|uniref:type II secretion system protein n=1 Tax=Granulicella sp. S190 TaxID=1747226 RepID=UPI00131D68B5|nr:type II secretion system protein [Granulicella sp. S190]
MRRLCSRLQLGRHNAGVVADTNERQSEQGFMLVGLIVAIFIILLVLSIAAPKVAMELRREREVEAVHRGNQYVRAIQLYYRKNNTYPATIDALAKGTPVKYLRQDYVDPLTGKADWRLIHVGEAKTTVKGFFGQPLAGLAPGLGAAASQVSSGGTGNGAAGSNSAFGSSNSGASGSSPGYGSSSSSSFGSSGSGSSAFGSSSSSGAGGFSSSTPSGTTSGSSTTGTGSSGSGSNGIAGTSTPGSPISGQSASSFSGSGAPFVGVGIPKEATSIVVLNEQTTYNTWEFIYDPRIEQLKAKAGLLGGGAQGIGGSTPGSSIGGGTSSFGSSGSSFGSGSSGSSSFGSSSGSSFGSGSSGSSFGSSPSSGAQGSGTSSPTTPQQPQ